MRQQQQQYEVRAAAAAQHRHHVEAAVAMQQEPAVPERVMDPDVRKIQNAKTGEVDENGGKQAEDTRKTEKEHVAKTVM